MTRMWAAAVVLAWGALFWASPAHGEITWVVKSGAGAPKASADSVGLDVNAPTTASQAGSRRWLAGTSARGPDVRGTGVQRFLQARDRILFFDPVESTTINGNLWGGVNATMTTSVSLATGIRLNNSGITTVNSVARIATNATFPYIRAAPLVARWQFRLSPTPSSATNPSTVYPPFFVGMDMGLVAMSSFSPPVDGVYFKLTPRGDFVAAMSYGSTETRSAPLTIPTQSVWHIATIIRRAQSTDFFVDDVLLATLTVDGVNLPDVSSIEHLPLSMRIYNYTTAPVSTLLLDVGQSVIYGEVEGSDKYNESLAEFGRKSVQAPLTAYARTANFTNSTNPTDRTLANATATGEATLSGLIDVVPTFVAETDYQAFSYTIPTGFQLWVYGVTCSAVNLVAANTSTGVNLGLFLGTNSNAVSLATTDAAGPPWTGWGPRRVALGNITFSPTAVIGATPTYPTGGVLDYKFQPPLVLESARFLHLGFHAHTANTTAVNQIVRFSCAIDGVFH